MKVSAAVKVEPPHQLGESSSLNSIFFLSSLVMLFTYFSLNRIPSEGQMFRGFICVWYRNNVEQFYLLTEKIIKKGRIIPLISLDRGKIKKKQVDSWNGAYLLLSFITVCVHGSRKENFLIYIGFLGDSIPPQLLSGKNWRMYIVIQSKLC